MKLSVIIPTRNRSVLLSQALKSIRYQYLPAEDFEVIVVDNGSVDATQEVIENHKAKIPNLSSFFAEAPGLHVGRHLGMKAAKSDLLVFADDDIEALPSWLSSVQEAFKDPAVAMVGGNNYPMFLEPPPKWLLALWNRRTSRGLRSIPWLSVVEFDKPRVDISPYLVWGCNFAIRKDVLFKAGGFHPDGMPKELIRFRGDGETHVSRYVAESGMKCVFHPGASVYHKVTPERMTHDYFRQRGFNQGVSDSYTQLRQQDLGVKSATKRSFVRRGLGYVFRKSWSALLRLAGSAEVNRAFEELKRGHAEGFAYHQNAYLADAEVREWVHLERYF